MSDPHSSTANPYPWEQPSPDRAARPTNPFIPFEAAEVEGAISHLFERAVRLYATRLAVKDAHAEFTYAELNQMANRVAWAILAEGEEGAPTVALLAERGAPAVAALLGVIKAGKAYVPLDPSYPPARLAYMLEDSQADLILAGDDHLALAARLVAERAGGRTYRVLGLSQLDPSLPTRNPGLEISPDAYAYILYTSGTTGRPKGVLGSHRQVLHLSKVFINLYHICPEDRISLVDSLCFSASLSKIFPTLLNGAAIMAFDIKAEGIGRVADWLLRERVTMYGSVPALFRQLCELLPAGQAFPDLRVIRLGGDRVERQDVELYKAHFGRHCLFQIGYGATEAKAITSLFINHDSEIADSADTPRPIVPVGYASDDVEILLLDEEGQPVGPGQVGEVVVRSRYLSPGYWRNPEETQARFLPDPDGGDRRLYVTGDLARMAADGCLTHLGRKDSQVKIRGYRIEIAEVEAALLDLESVREAAVVLQRLSEGVQQLVAYVVPAPAQGGREDQAPAAPTASSLRRALAERLPDYMIPAQFVLLDRMPLNENAKVDRHALPEPETTRPELESAYVAPRDEVESQIVQVWQDVLGVQPIGVQDSFYELGGDSLLVARLFARVEAQFDGIRRDAISLDPFFRSPTVEQLASIYSRALSAGETQAGPVVQARRRKSGRKPHRDPPLVEIRNRLLQILALYAPGARTLRVRMHRMRGVRIGRDVFIGLGVILESGHPRMISIGNRVTISVRSVVIAHFRDVARKARLSHEASVRIEDNAYIGPGVIILPNVTIGQGAVVAAGSIVNQSVPPLTMVQGNPARVVARCGIPLVGNTYEQFVRNLELVQE